MTTTTTTPAEPYLTHQSDPWWYGEGLFEFLIPPGHFDELFRELGLPATPRTLPAPGTVPFDVPRVMAEQRRRGTEVVGPPMAP